jgi:hypothetical protein
MILRKRIQTALAIGAVIFGISYFWLRYTHASPTRTHDCWVVVMVCFVLAVAIQGMGKRIAAK